MSMNKLWSAAILVIGLSTTGTVAMAGTVFCPGTVATTDREFFLTTAGSGITCLASAPGNISGNGDTINGLGFITLDKSDDTTTGVANGSLTITGSGTTGGTFTITPPAGYHNFVLALKSGEGTLDPDWAAFAIPDGVAGVLSGIWGILGNQGLSHANLYGQVCDGSCPPRETSPVPLPGALGLLLLALSSLGVFGWMRRRVSV